MEVLLSLLAKKVLDKALDALAERPAIQRVRRLLAGDPARAALVRAIRKAYAELEKQYPQLAADAFHETFFRQEEVVAELARILSRRPDEMPSPERLAELACAQYRPGYKPPLERLLPAAELFLRRFQEAAEGEAELRPFFDSRALERLHEIAALVRAYRPVPYRKEVGTLMDFYTEHFVGREEAIQAVTDFTAQEEGGYLLIEAGPGMGKTALIAQLVHRYERGTWRPGGVADHPPLLYAFLRQEKGWHTPLSFLATLDSQLLDALDIPGGVPTDVEALGRLFTALWSEAAARARPNRPLTLLVDGLDEMVPDERGRTVAHFPPDYLPPHVHVVVTSRPQPKAFDWVPLDHPLRKAQVHRLARFGPQEVRALLAQAGDAVPRDDAFIQRLVDLTRGEPLFLRYLCEDVADWGEEAEARLDALPPLEEVEDYFRMQLGLLDERAEGEDIHHILGMLVVARGGMTADELADALEMPKWRVLDALKPVRRFLLGEERMELMHLEFRRLVEREWFTKRERKSYEERLLDYCARWREHESDYALEHYAAHLFEVGRREELYGLIDREWMELKRRRTGSHRSFAADVDLAFRAAEGEGVEGLPRLVQCALLSATLGSLAAQVPPEVLGVMARLGQAGRALDYARLMVDPRRKAEALRLIGLALWEQDKPEEAVAVLEEALEVAKTIEVPWAKAEALSSIASALARAGRLEEALEVARDIEWPWRKAEALSFVASALAQTGRTEETKAALVEALEAAEAIKEPWWIPRALSSIASALDQAGQPEEAEAILKEALHIQIAIIEQLSGKAGLLSFLASLLAQTGQVEEALQVARAIEEPDEKARALSRVASSLAQTGRPEEAGAILEEAFEVARTIREPWEQAKALSSVASSLAQMGQLEEALEVARTIEKPDEKAEALSSITSYLAQMGQIKKAGATIEEALQVAMAIEQPSEKAEALPSIASSLAQAGQPEEALEVARTIEEPWHKVRALSSIASAFAQAGRLDEAIDVAGAIEWPFWKAKAFPSIASALAQTGQVEKARAVLKEALQIVRTTEGPKAEALSSIASSLAQVGQVEEARAILKEALQTARTIEGPEAKALASIASALAQIGWTEEARVILEEALQTARATEEPFWKAEALSSIASALAKTHQTEDALAVLEEALEVARTIELPLEKAKALSSVAGAWMGMGREKMVLAVAQEAFRAARYARRGGAFSFLGSSTPILASFGPEVLAETWRLVEEVESWWA